MSPTRLKTGLLFIAYAFPPFKSMSSFRNHCITKYSENVFNDIWVLSTSNSKYLPKEDLGENGAQVIFNWTLDYRTVLHSEKSSGVVDKGSSSRHLVRRIKNSFPFNLLLDLGGLGYIIFSSIRGASIVRNNEISHIYSSFFPYADILIGYILKTIFPRLHWTIDINNLHIEPDNPSVIMTRFQKVIDRMVFKKANIILTVSEGLRPQLEAFHKKILVLENGIDNLEYSDINNQSRFDICYTGSIYPHQKWECLLLVLGNLLDAGIIDKNRISLNYAGASSELWRERSSGFKYPEILKDHGVLSLSESCNLQSSSNINLLLSWNTENVKTIIPGKYYDYIRARTPILLVVNGGRDIGWEDRFQALKNSHIGYENDQSSIESITSFIDKTYSEWSSGNPRKLIPFSEVKKHHWSERIKVWHGQI